MSAPPLVNRRIIEALLDTELPRATGRRLVLVHARYDESAPSQFTARIDGQPRRVRVTDQASVLGIVDAWQQHQAVADDRSDLLVVTSGVADSQLGWDVRAHAVRRRSLTVDRAEIVKQLFGATDLDPRIRREQWLLDALLEAEPTQGWPRSGAVLTRDAAMRALVGERLGLTDSGPGGSKPGDVLDLDADVLLGWSRSAAGPARFAELSADEQSGLRDWLAETVGSAVPVLLSLAAAGRGADAMALGVVGAVLTSPGASADAGVAVGGLFGSIRPRLDDLRAFTGAVTGTVARWIAEAEGSGSQGEAARQRVFEVLDRADELAASAGLEEALAGDPHLPSGFRTRLRALAASLGGSPSAAEAALEQVTAHHLSGLFAERCETAGMAVRLVRWLAEPLPAVGSVASAVSAHLADWGWVDRAMAVLWAGDSAGDPLVGQAYRTLFTVAQDRRRVLDERFARQLAAWVPGASAQNPGGCLLMEEVLARIALPLAAERPPLVLVLDGMSSAVAAQLGDELDRRVWTEVVPKGSAGSGLRRGAAVSVLPSVTKVSRASLLSGGLTAGGQSVEAAGFDSFWKRHRREAVLFHKAQIGGSAGHRLAPELVDALSGSAVVGVVLNTIDDALDHGQQGERTVWRMRDISFLPELLNTARDYGRPVLLVSDHGHVLDRSPVGDGPAVGSADGGSRWRTGTPGEGEVELAGPRVLEGGGRIVAPWQEDIRYRPRKAGYHGGASLAEVTVPLLALLPDPGLVPAGWAVLPREQVRPGWWEPRSDTAAATAPVPPAQEAKKSGKRRSPAQEGDGLFATVEVAPEATPSSTGNRVVASRLYETQKAFVRKAPEGRAVAAVIDALAAAGGKLSPGAVAAASAEATGRAQRNPEFFISVLQRLLNVEGYPVIGLIESGRTVALNVALLREQFGLEES